MRILFSRKPIPASYLKSGKDHGTYDAVVKLWLPGRTTPIDRPDLRLVKRKGVRDPGVFRGSAPSASVAPTLAPTPKPADASPPRKGTGLLIPRRRVATKPLVVAKR